MPNRHKFAAFGLTKLLLICLNSILLRYKIVNAYFQTQMFPNAKHADNQ
jgi:hypothetical protein